METGVSDNDAVMLNIKHPERVFRSAPTSVSDCKKTNWKFINRILQSKLDLLLAPSHNMVFNDIIDHTVR